MYRQRRWITKEGNKGSVQTRCTHTYGPPLIYTRWGEVTSQLTVSQSVCLGIEHPCATCVQILLPVGMLFKFTILFLWGALSDERTGLQLQCNHPMVRVAQNPQPYFTASSETPPTWRGQVLVFIFPRNRVAQLYPRAFYFGSEFDWYSTHYCCLPYSKQRWNRTCRFRASGVRNFIIKKIQPSLYNMGSLTSHNPIGLHGTLRE
jgi:hypothetical protein